MHRFILVLLISALTPLPADAYYIDGNYLHQRCKEKSPFVVGYVTGVVDAHGLSGANPSRLVSGCIPFRVSSSQASDVVCKYLESNPKGRHQVASLLVDEAVVEAWPCN